MALVHCETSTGVLQPLEEIGQLARAHGAMFLVDSVASLGGQRLPVDELGIDICYSGSQKSLSCPPGLAPITMSPRAVAAMKSRKTLCRSWYLDLSMLDEYWISGRKYHHTAPASMIYALRESLRILVEEGLENSFARHQLNADALRAGVDAMGLSIVAEEEVRSNTLNGVRMPDGVDANAVRMALLKEHNIETGGGLGPFAGKVVRVGLMGYSSQESNVLLVLSALARVLNGFGLRGCGLGGSGGGESGLRWGVLARLLFLPVRLVQQFNHVVRPRRLAVLSQPQVELQHATGVCRGYEVRVYFHHIPHLAVQNLHGEIRVDDIVDARRSAALVGVAHLSKLHAGNRRQQLARRLLYSLGVDQVA